MFVLSKGKHTQDFGWDWKRKKKTQFVGVSINGDSWFLMFAIFPTTHVTWIVPLINYILI